MAKPLRTREILNFLLKKGPLEKPLYSQREISRTLGVSQTTIHRINSALKDYFASGHSENDLKDKEDIELNRLLLANTSTSVKLSNEDFEIILKHLEAPGETASSLLKKLQEEINTDEFSEYGKTFLRSCTYQTFNLNLHNFCKKMDYSDRFIFKPAEYMELGVIPIKQRFKDQDLTSKSLKEIGRFLFYSYLPFSREVAIVLVDGKMPDFTNKIITSLILFLKTSQGLPLRIIGKGRIEEVFSGADLPLMKDFFSFCALLYSSNKRHSVFESKETALIERILRTVDLKNLTDLKLQDLITAEVSDHNKKCKAFYNEKTVLMENPLPEGSFVHNLGVGRLQENCHVRFQGHWYSSKYTYKKVPLQLTLEFCDGEIYFITKPLTVNSKQEILSKHPYHFKKEDNKQKYEARYSTRKEDLPPNDEEARKYGLWTEEDLLLKIAVRFHHEDFDENRGLVPDPDSSIIKIAKNYIKSKGEFPQQAFILLKYLCNIPDARIKTIETGCDKIVTAPVASWNKSLADLLFSRINEKKQDN